MEISSMPEIFGNKLRLSVISALVTGEKSFSELKNIRTQPLATWERSF